MKKCKTHANSLLCIMGDSSAHSRSRCKIAGRENRMASNVFRSSPTFLPERIPVGKNPAKPGCNFLSYGFSERSIIRNFIFCVLLLAGMSSYSVFAADNQSSNTATGDPTSKDRIYNDKTTADQSESEDDIFSNEPITSEIPKTDQNLFKPPQIVEKKLDIGGKFVSTFSAQPTWLFGDLSAGSYVPSSDLLYLDLGMTLFLDSRPDDHFRVYTKLNVYYPYNLNTKILSTLPSSDNLKIMEMFADFDINRIVFFRAGKQTIKWGVGYFFSPADIINTVPIDPQNPTNDTTREGPVAIKMQIPIQTTNLYGYIIDYDVTHPEDLAFAAKGEFVVSTLETTVGLFYKKDAPPKGMLAFTFPWGDFNFFAEGVLGYGSGKNFVQTTLLPPYFKTYTRSDEWFLDGTAGIQWMLPDYDFMVIGQYYYNGEGYADDSIILNNFPQIGALIATDKLSLNDILYSSMHYIGLMINWTRINKSDFGAGVFWLANLSDSTGQIKPFVSYTPNNWINLTLSVPISYGDKLFQLSPDNTIINSANISVLFQASIGGSPF